MGLGRIAVMTTDDSLLLDVMTGVQEETMRYEFKPTATEVRELRHANGWTQKNLADLLGVSIKSVQAYEQGRRAMPVPTWRLAQLMGEYY